MSSESESLLDIDEEQSESVSLIRNTNMEAQAAHSKIKRYNRIYAAATILGVILIVLTFYWLNQFSGGFSLSTPKTEFNWHPLLMVLGMLFLNSQSILVYRTGRNLPKFKVKCIHAGLHITIIILVLLAQKAVFDSHNYASPPVPNLYSLHSWVGILTIGLFVCQLIGGFATFLYPGASKNVRATVLPYHVAFGSTAFIMAVITCSMGFVEKAIFLLSSTYQELPLAGTVINLIGVLTVIFGVLVIYLVNDADYKREEIIDDGVALSE